MAKGIYKRGNVFWIRYAGLDGKIIFESSHGEKFKEAQDLLIQRKGELLSLTLENVDLKHGFILLDRTKNGERRDRLTILSERFYRALQDA